MWISKIVDKNLSLGELRVNVSYSNGTDDFNEVYSIRNEQDLNARIKNKLSELEDKEIIFSNIQTGVYTPVDNQVVVNPLEQKMTELRKLKEQVSLGLMKETDKEYLDAISAVKAIK